MSHALSIEEKNVWFLPEFANGGQGGWGLAKAQQAGYVREPRRAPSELCLGHTRRPQIVEHDACQGVPAIGTEGDVDAGHDADVGEKRLNPDPLCQSLLEPDGGFGGHGPAVDG